MKELVGIKVYVRKSDSYFGYSHNEAEWLEGEIIGMFCDNRVLVKAEKEVLAVSKFDVAYKSSGDVPEDTGIEQAIEQAQPEDL